MKIKTMLPYLTAIGLSYYIFLSLLLLVGEMEAGVIFLFMGIPFACLVFSFIYGVNHSFNIHSAVE